MDKCIPKKTVKTRQNLPWLDHKMRKKISKKNRFHRRAKKSKPQHRERRWDAYLSLQSEVKKDISEAYDSYINSLFEDADGKPSKKIWQAFKARKRDQVGIPPLKQGSKLVTTSKEKAQALSDQYESVFIKKACPVKDRAPSRV